MRKEVSTADLIQFALSRAATNLALFPWRPNRVFAGQDETIAQYYARLGSHYVHSSYHNQDGIGRGIRGLIDRALEYGPEPQETITIAFGACIATMARENNMLFEFPNPPSGDHGPDIILRARLDELHPYLLHEDRIREVFHTTVVDLMLGLMDEFPEALHKSDGSQPFTVPAYSLIPNLGNIVARVLVTFLSETAFEDEFPAALAFAHTRNHLIQNLLSVSNLSLEQAEKAPHRITSPESSNLAPQALIEKYLGGTGLEKIFLAEVPLAIPRKAFQEHGAIFAPTGHGKTQLLQHIIASFIEDDPPAMFIIDGMGTMLKKLEQLPAFRNELSNRLVVFDPVDKPPLNFFQLHGGSDAQQMELFTYLFSAFDQALSPKMTTAVRFIVKLMQSIPGASLHTMFKLVTEDVKKVENSDFAKDIARLPEVPRAFFRSQFFTSNFRPTLEAVQTRLFAVMENEAFREMFSAPTNCFDPGRFIQEKKIVLLNTDRFLLSDEGSAILGRFFIAQCLGAALARAQIPPQDRHLALLIVDEAKDYFDEKTEKILTDARQFGLGLLFATQYVGQLDDNVRVAMYNNTRIKMAGPVETETDTVATALRTTPQFIRSMQAKDNQYAEFATHIRGLTSTALKLRVPYGTVEKLIEGAPPLLPRPKPTPASQSQQANEFSLRDVDLPLPANDEVPVAKARAAPAFAIGDWVTIEIGGALVFEEPVCVRDIQEHQGELWLFVEGSQTGIEAKHAQKADAPQSPPPPNQRKRFSPP